MRFLSLFTQGKVWHIRKYHLHYFTLNYLECMDYGIKHHIGLKNTQNFGTETSYDTI